MNDTIGKVAVIGAGTMGAGLAGLVAGAGIPVYLLDVVPKEADGTSLEGRSRLAKSAKERICTGRQATIYHQSLSELIHVGNLEDHLELIEECDWVVEAVLENLEIKKTLFTKLQPHIKDSAILSTNTSGLAISAISEVLPKNLQTRFMGTHFFNPPRFMRLVELIPGPETAERYKEKISHFITHRLGKGIVTAKDTPNFIANRVGAYSSSSVMRLAQSYGYNVVKADQLTGEVMGRPRSATFKTLDMVGLDIFSNVVQNLVTRSTDPQEIIKYSPPDYLFEMVSQGMLGDKVTGGFYKKVKKEAHIQRFFWDINKAEYLPLKREKLDVVERAMKAETPQSRLYQLVWGEQEENKFAWEVIKECLLYTAKITEEIADNYESIDQAMRLGYNWLLGPFEIWDGIGVKKSVERMVNEGQAVPIWVINRLKEGKNTFYDAEKMATPYIQLAAAEYEVVKENPEAVIKNLDDGVICLEFKSKGSTVTDYVVNLLDEAITILEGQTYKGLLIGNQNKNFCVGANLVHIYELARNKNWKALEKSILDFQTVNQKMKYCKKPIVVAPHGQTLGGGAEMAMHASFRVPLAETYMGLVEMGVGLVPGGGGVKEMLARNTPPAEKALPKLIDVAKQVWESIAMAKVSSSAHDAIAFGMLSANDLVAMNQDYQLSDAKAELIHLFDRGYRVSIEREIPVTGRTGQAAIELIRYNLLEGGFISDYDAHLADQVARIVTGGNVLSGTKVSENHLLSLEREAFLSLSGEPKTLARIDYMLKHGKPLRN